MKVKNLWCPTELAVVERDHYEKEECLDPPAPEVWLARTLEEIEGDTDHRDNKFTATRLTTCPRATALRDNLPVTIDLTAFNNLMHGIAGHAWLASGKGTAYKEMRFPIAGKDSRLFVGTPSEVPVSGRVDLISPDACVIKDYKFHGADQQRFKYEDVQKGVVDEDWRVQFSVYKMLAERSIEGAHIDRAYAWNGAMVGKRSSAPAWFKTSIPFLSEEQILKLHPLGGKTSVAENIAITKQFHLRLEAINALETTDLGRLEATEQAIAEMPLSGQDMGWRGKKGGFTSKCGYCEVKRDCDRLAGVVGV